MNIVTIDVRSDSRFRTVQLDALEDPALSANAKTVLYYVTTRPPGWRFNQADILRKCNIGRDAFYRALKDLETLGYARSTQIRDGGRFDGVRWELCQGHLPAREDPPCPENPDTVPPCPEKPDTVKPDTGNPQCTKNHGVSTDHVREEPNACPPSSDQEDPLTHFLRMFVPEPWRQAYATYYHGWQSKQPTGAPEWNHTRHTANWNAYRDYWGGFGPEEALEVTEAFFRYADPERDPYLASSNWSVRALKGWHIHRAGWPELKERLDRLSKAPPATEDPAPDRTQVNVDGKLFTVGKEEIAKKGLQRVIEEIRGRRQDSFDAMERAKARLLGGAPA